MEEMSAIAGFCQPKQKIWHHWLSDSLPLPPRFCYYLIIFMIIPPSPALVHLPLSRMEYFLSCTDTQWYEMVCTSSNSWVSIATLSDHPLVGNLRYLGEERCHFFWWFYEISWNDCLGFYTMYCFYFVVWYIFYWFNKLLNLLDHSGIKVPINNEISKGTRCCRNHRMYMKGMLKPSLKYFPKSLHNLRAYKINT